MAGVEDWSVVASSNTASPPTGAPEGMAPSTVNDTMRQMMANVRKEWAFNSLTATTTMSIGSLGYGYATVITDANKSISSFDTIAAGVERELVFGVAATLVHDATKMILPGSANITAAAGDVARFRSEGSGNWRCVSYQRASGAGVDRGWILISTAAASNSATIDFSSGLTSTHDLYMVTMTDIIPASDGVNLLARVSQSATFRDGAADYGYAQGGGSSAPAAFNNGSTSASSLLIASGLSNANTARNFSGEFFISNPAGTSLSKPCHWTCGYLSNTPSYIYANGFGEYYGGTSGSGTAAVDGLRFLMSSGNITSGNFALYGLRKS